MGRRIGGELDCDRPQKINRTVQTSTGKAKDLARTLGHKNICVAHFLYAISKEEHDDGGGYVMRALGLDQNTLEEITRHTLGDHSSKPNQARDVLCVKEVETAITRAQRLARILGQDLNTGHFVATLFISDQNTEAVKILALTRISRELVLSTTLELFGINQAQWGELLPKILAS